MKKYFLSFIALIATYSTLFSQVDTSCWKSEKHVEENHYILTIPDNWKKVNLSVESEYRHKFEFTGIGVPTMLNSAPITAFFTLKEVSDKSLAETMEAEMQSFLNLKDRIADAGVDFDSTDVVIKSGEAAKYLHTKYYRRVKVQNYSSYFLFLESPKDKKILVLNLHFAYKDASYKIEFNAKLREYADRVFTKFKLR